MNESIPLSNALNHALLRLITQHKDQNILLVSKYDSFNQQAKQTAQQLTIHTNFSDNDSEESPTHWFLGIVICQTNEDDTRTLEKLLAKMRDIQCERVYFAHCDAFSIENDAQIRSLGFKRITPNKQDAEGQEVSEHLYYFDIFDYKQIPEWLNNDYWSNPEMWDKARW